MYMEKRHYYGGARHIHVYNVCVCAVIILELYINALELCFRYVLLTYTSVSSSHVIET